MFNFFLKATELDVRSFLNQVLCYFRKIPVLKELAPGSMYKMKGLKKLFTFFSPLGATLIKIFKLSFSFMFAYFFMLGISYWFTDSMDYSKGFLRVILPFILLDFSNFYIRDKKSSLLLYYNLFNVDPRTASLSGIVLREAFDIIGAFFVYLLMFRLLGVSPTFAFTLVISQYFLKTFFNGLNLLLFDKKILKKDSDISHGLIATIVLLLVIVSLFFFNLDPIEIFFSRIFFLVSIVLGILSFVYLFKFPRFTQVISIMNESYGQGDNKTAKEKQLDNISKLKKEDLEKSKGKISKDLTGYSLLNEIFFQRHRRLILKPILIKAAIAFVACAALVIGVVYMEKVDELLKLLPGFIPFAAYFSFFHESLTRVMFVNCDQALMQYGFYTRPKDLLEMFKHRLKKLLLWNSLPVIMIIVAMGIIFALESPNPLSVLLIIIQSISMWVFFSVHTLFIYYIFQPYTDEYELKHPIYKIINFLVYIICYISMTSNLSGPLVAPIFIGVTIIYSVVALVLVYKLASTRFKVRIGR